MPTTRHALGKRLKWLAALSIMSIVLLGGWLLMAEPPGTTLPEIEIIDDRPRPEVTLRQGRIVGVEVESGYPQVLEEFLGIPYGLPPTGDRRFRPPVGINASSTAVIDAGTYGLRCVAGGLVRNAPQGENCLNLNIYRPLNRTGTERLPVVVHVHGGSFNFGAGNTRPISSFVAWSVEPILGVSFNYRIGALGFLPSTLTEKEGLLNLGLKDQALLFEWVQENIAEFGGDPDNVTLMGSSAGAHSIGHHLLLNTGRPPLFHKVIMESGAPTARAIYPPTSPLLETQFNEFLTLLGCEDIPEEHIMSTLRTLPLADIKKASESIFRKYDPSVRWPWQPVIDGPGGMIPIPPIEGWRAGKWHQIPILTGFTTNEGAMFVPTKASSSEQFTSFFRTLLPGLDETDLTLLNTLYPDPNTNTSSSYLISPGTRSSLALGAQYKRLEAAYGQFAYAAPVRHTAFFASPHVPVYLYHFAAQCDVKSGADHGSHAGFVTFDEDISEVSDGVEEIAGGMHAYWTSFVSKGDPNAVKEGRWGGRVRWPVYNGGGGAAESGEGEEGEGEGEERERGQIMVFGEGNDEVAGGSNTGVAMEVKPDDWAVEECGFWWERVEKFETEEP